MQGKAGRGVLLRVLHEHAHKIRVPQNGGRLGRRHTA
jgi:hypothetical protein